MNSADVLHDHNVIEDIHENILTPGHQKRVETAAYAKEHKHLVRELDLPCIVCGVRNSTLKDPAANRFKAKGLQTHHRYVEWSLMNAVDLDKFNSRLLPFLHATHPEEELYNQPFDRQTLNDWVDHHPHNLWVICDVHHVGRNTGIHYLAMPIWGVQDLLEDRYQQQVMKMLLAPHDHN
jgi:hypothetical protein